MEYSLPAWLGALVGTVLAVAIYVPLIGVIEHHIRLRHGPVPAEHRAEFDNRMSVLRRFILAIKVAAFATAGYWLGVLFGGPH